MTYRNIGKTNNQGRSEASEVGGGGGGGGGGVEGVGGFYLKFELQC
jgi:hypothetical protein